MTGREESEREGDEGENDEKKGYLTPQTLL
jgi:hypothetical protein